MTLTRQNGSTDTIGSIYKRIARGSVITTWDDSLTDYYGKLFFVYDVRPNSKDLPEAGAGLVFTPFSPDLKEVIQKRFVQYPKNAYPFSKYDAEIFGDVSKFYPTLDATIGNVGQVGTTAPDYGLEAFIDSVENAPVNLPLQNELADYPPVTLIIGILRTYLTFYLHAKHRKKIRIAALPEPSEYRRAFKINRKVDEKLLYVEPGSVVEFTRIGIYEDGHLNTLLLIKEDWKAAITNLFQIWNRQKYLQKPNR